MCEKRRTATWLSLVLALKISLSSQHSDVTEWGIRAVRKKTKVELMLLKSSLNK